MIMERQEGQDRRMFERFPARFPVRFKDSRNDYGTSVVLRNASAGGITVLTKEHVYVDDSVTLEVALPDCRAPLTLRGQVVWTKREDPDVWDVGIKFHKIDFVNLSRLYRHIPSSVSSG